MNLLKHKEPVIGTGDFVKLLESTTFVDKSLLIPNLLHDGAEALLITRPRRWGKTLNLSMLYHFLRCEVREDAATGKLQTVNPNLGLFNSLKVSQEHPELVADHQGQWPVVSLTLKGVAGSSLDELEEGFKDVLAELYDQHIYLNHWLLSQDKETMLTKAEYFSNVVKRKESLAGLKRSLRFLSELLYEYHARKVFVLLDEYDSPLNNTFLAPSLYKQVLIFLRSLLGNCFKDNPYLEKGLMTGILRVAKADLFSGLNNFKEYSLLDERYAEHFGFTDKEVTNLFNQPTVKKLLSTNAPDPKQIKAWYNGYTIGGMTIYNPWSIMMCISEQGKLAPYWVTTGSDTLLRDLLRDNDNLLQQLEQLLAEDSLEVTISPHINMLNMTPEIKFWSLMLAAGYVTLVKKMSIGPSIKLACEVRVPNMEVKAAHEDLIMGWFTSKVGIAHYTEMINSLFYGETEAFSSALNRYLAEATSLRNVGPHRAEQFYNGFMLGLFTVMHKEFSIASEVESGKGYADALMIPRSKRAPGAVVFEYKVAKSRQELSKKAKEALQQIDQKAYITSVKQYEHIEQIVKVGVAFYGKGALVRRVIVSIS